MANTTVDAALLTAEQAAALGDIGPYELVEGRIVHMAPTGDEHARTESRLTYLLGVFVYPNRLGELYNGEAGIIVRRNPDTVRGADIAFIARARVAPGTGKFLAVVPDLVVEIVSPDDRWSEITRKVGEYFAAGVRLVWVVDPDARTVHVYTSPNTSRTFGEGDTLPGDDVLPGFALPVAEIFAE
jgi:Uma2 family endonuclease